MREDEDRKLLAELLDQHAHALDEQSLEAFTEWREVGRPITGKMRKWLRDVALRLGLIAEESQNLFSALSPERQAEMRQRAKNVRLPWEK